MTLIRAKLGIFWSTKIGTRGKNENLFQSHIIIKILLCNFLGSGEKVWSVLSFSNLTRQVIMISLLLFQPGLSNMLSFAFRSQIWILLWLRDCYAKLVAMLERTPLLWILLDWDDQGLYKTVLTWTMALSQIRLGSVHALGWWFRVWNRVTWKHMTVLALGKLLKLMLIQMLIYVCIHLYLYQTILTYLYHVFATNFLSWTS